MRHALLQRFGHGLLVLWAAFTLSFVLLQVLQLFCACDFLQKA